MVKLPGLSGLADLTSDATLRRSCLTVPSGSGIIFTMQRNFRIANNAETTILAGGHQSVDVAMALANDISRSFYSVQAAGASSDVAAHLRTLIVDALACVLGGADSEIAQLAARSAGGRGPGPAPATILPKSLTISAAEAALVNGTMLRSLDFMDVYVDADVSHPSESIPAALACAEAHGASGRAFLDTVLAALTFHVHLASTVPLHRHGLHHVGHAAWVVPLIAARLAGLGEAGAANALNLSAAGLIVPEGFSRGQVANVKAMAFPLIAKRAIEFTELGAAGLGAQPGACEEVVRLLGLIAGEDLDPATLIPPAEPARIETITLKAYPAQYALQPLVAAGAAFRRREPERIDAIDHIIVRAAKQTVARTADRAKFRPITRESADHSLPFCLACGLLDGGLSAESLRRERWKDADILRLTAAMEVEATGADDAFAVGRQEILLTFTDGASARLDCSYPPEGVTWRQIALDKLSTFAAGRCDAGRIVAIVENLENETSVAPLVDALCGRNAARARAS